MTSPSPRIMVVDDDPGLRTTLEAILEDEGYDVTTAEDGYAAVELARQTSYSLIFMDIKMPGMNGVEALREIKKVRPDSVVVMQTGFAVEGLIREAVEEGAYAVLHKPVAVEEIIRIITELTSGTGEPSSEKAR